MSENSYRVILSGEIAEGESMEDVAERLAAMFKTSVLKIKQLLERDDPVIKRNVDKKTADRYRTAIEKAGATCRIEPIAAPGNAEPAVPATEAEPEENRGPNVVPVEMVFRSEERFKPQAVETVSGTDRGIVYDDPFDAQEGPAEKAFEKISAVAAFAGEDQKTRFLVFIKKQQHPVVCEIDNIDFSGFPVQTLANPAATLRSFIYFLCSRHPSIIIDETTLDFLSGSPLPAMDDKKIERFSTALGRLIESGGKG